ncbi:GUN4 domain-containing protein [Crocosphaera sp. XPORK-15E]|uniref:GUN4 domain-containing protein n=1 Tax=Crocosphaera sp. XPORK-15E TaxID=3110247 RepID=UPI002B2168D8|nr:GUN4 domain-containing protein [Crocosphaera sp. XPORK-15E]MEA5533100.1 GUN4 domain-containing protein [Crocosphaera sp. XPORK-15E]
MVNGKRLQVFVSSTYLDLIEERQIAVQGILAAGHIPAGMELFTAGDRSQWEVIKQWIDQSDVYLLILGGRYGSIEPTTGKSYIHLEYEYALEKSIPVFSCVIRNADKRAMEKGDIQTYLERNNTDKYNEFKKLVTSKMVTFWENHSDIERSIILTLKEFEKRDNIIGWVRGNKVEEGYLNQIEALKKELNNNKLEYQKQIQEKDNIITQLQQQIPKKNPKIEEIELKSEKGIDYTKLRDFLAEGKWREANQETANVMLQAANRVSERWLRIEDIDNFPCEDLSTVDQLWVHYSQGKFGFSVQKKIYVDDLGGTKEHNEEIWQQFCDRVGWTKTIVNKTNITYKLLDSTPLGHLPYCGRVLGNIDTYFMSDLGVSNVGSFLFDRVTICSEYLTKTNSLPSPHSNLTPKEKAEKLRKVIARLSKESANLPDEALYRDTVYDQ